jgi:hypothetical protein
VLVIEDASDGNFELSSMFNSMNTSMLIAQECLKNETEEDTTFQGLETFAATIDSSKSRRRATIEHVHVSHGHRHDQSTTNLFTCMSIVVLARVRITLSDTVIRLEHLIKHGEQGVALEIRVKK